MKKRLGIAFCLISSLFLSSIAPVFATLQAEPVSRLPFNQQDLYQTDLFTGSASYSYPIKVPKGTNDLTPDVFLSYNSSATNGTSSYVGMGWDLNIDYVERDVHFTPANTSDDTFKLHFKGATYDLIYISGEGRYHTKIESNLKIEKKTTGNYYGEHWVVTDVTGTQYRFGTTYLSSELTCDTRAYARAWNIDQIEDRHGNIIYYTYTTDNGLRYLSKIEYNTEKARSIEFTYTTNPYQRSLYLQGCPTIETKRLSDIKVKTNASLVHQFDLGFVTATNSGQLLQSITERGSTGTASALPATTFEYKQDAKSWNTTGVKWIDHATLDTNIDEPNPDTTLADVNGDGLVDIVKTLTNGGSNTWKVLLNQGSSWSTSFQTWVNDYGMDAALNKSDTRLIDVTGDGLPDIVRSYGTTWTVWRNTGTSWNTSGENWIQNVNINADLADTAGRNTIMDVDGDGLADIVHTDDPGDGYVTWEIFKNTGSSWSTSGVKWIDHTLLPYTAVLSRSDVRLLDVNGDGLPDIVRTTNSGTNDTWYVYKNTGSSWLTSAETWVNNASIDAYIGKTDTTLSDVNGDGLVDIVKSDDLGGGDRWKVLLNKGNSWSTSWETWIDPASGVDSNVSSHNIRVADVTGDSLPDIVRGQKDCACNENTWTVWQNTGSASQLLANVHTSQGATISFDYTKSTSYDNTGADSLSDLPFPLWLVSSMTTNNGMSGAHATSDVTTYSYKDGYYDWQDREFRGFAEITEILPNTTKRKYIFNQDDNLKGRLSSVQTDDAFSIPYVKSENTWTVATNSGVMTVNLADEKQYTYDGATASAKVRQTSYTYDSYGNPTKISELGDTSVSGDERFTYNEYTASTSAWLVNTLKHTYRNASDDSTKVSETYLYYDQHSGNSDAPHFGDVTKKVDWLSGGSNPETNYTYDSYGNVATMTDANNHTTTSTYDTTKTYPATITNVKSQQISYSYDLGTGNLLSKTDPNGLTTTYEYDVFGRITKDIKQYDNSSYPSISYQYLVDGVAPEGTLISKREVSSTSATLDVMTYVDGLGRKVQTRADAEDTSKQIVTDTFYDPTGEVLRQTVPYLASSSASFATPGFGISDTEMSYDPLGRVSIVTNPKGDSKTTAYDHWKVTDIDEKGAIKRRFVNAFDKITKVEEVLGATTSATLYTYNARDDLTQITDDKSNVFSFSYDTLSRKTAQTDPDMGTWSYTYDPVGNLLNTTDARGITTGRSYDELNRLTAVNYPTDTDSSFAYDLGKIGTLSIATNSAGTINYTYDDRLRKIEEQRLADSMTWTTGFSYDSADRLVTRTNPDGTLATYSFNNQGETESLSGIVSNVDYNSLGKITKKDFDNGVTTNYTYNMDDFRLNRIQTGSLFDKNYTYDAVGNVASITDNLLSKTQTFTYDDLDRLKTATESAGFNYAYDYNSIGNLTKFTSAGIDTNYSYGSGSAKPHALTATSGTASTSAATISISNLTTGSDSDGGSSSTTSSVTPGANKLELLSVSSRTGISTNPNQPTVTGNGLTWVAVNSVVYDTTSSSRRRVTLFRAMGSSPSTGSLSISFGGQNQTDVTWSLDEASGVDTSGTDGSGAIVQSGVNNGQAVSSLTATLGTFASSANATYGSFGNGGEGNMTAGSGFSITNQIQVASTIGVSAEIKMANDTTVDISSATADIGGIAIEIKAGTVSTQSYESVSVANLTSGTDTDNNSTATTALVSPTANKLIVLTVASRTGITADPNQPTATSSGLTWVAIGSTVYDPSSSSRRRVTVFRAMGSSATAGAISIDFGGQSQTDVSWVVDQVSGVDTSGSNGSGAVVQSATSNGQGVTGLTVTLASFGGTQNATYGGFGNGGEGAMTAGSGFSIVGQNGVSGTIRAGSEFKSSNDTTVDISSSTADIGGIAFELKAASTSAGTAYTYDANGNMTSDGTKCYEYNEANQLKKVKTCSGNTTIAEYVYDHEGNRFVKKTYVGGAQLDTIYSLGDEYETRKLASNGATFNTTYYKVNGELVAKKNSDGSKYYYHNDHLGSSSVITNQSGTLVESTTYDPYGKVLAGGAVSKFQYTGQEKDSETGLDYYGARYYNSDIRRFTQPDDIIQDVYNPQDLNRYAYVRNNPLRYTDPSGHGVFDSILKVVTKIPVIGSLIAKIPVVQQYMQWVESPKTTTIKDLGKQITTNQNVQKGMTTVNNVAKQGGDSLSKTATNIGNTVKVHGNDLRSTVKTTGYYLRDLTNHAIKKVGETTQGLERYTKEYYKENNVYMDPQVIGTKAEMRIWEHEQIGEFIFKNGSRPEFNYQVDRAVNIFR